MKEAYRKDMECKSLKPRPDHSNPFIKLALTRVLTTPPTPKAGIILAMRAKELLSQSRLTLAKRSEKPSFSCLLYKSKPRRWRGVDSNWIAAGAMNWAADMGETCFCIPSESGSMGARTGGTLNDANTVKQSRTAKRT